MIAQGRYIADVETKCMPSAGRRETRNSPRSALGGGGLGIEGSSLNRYVETRHSRNFIEPNSDTAGYGYLWVQR